MSAGVCGYVRITFPNQLLALSLQCTVSTFEAACKLGPQYLVTAIRRVKDALLEDAEQVAKASDMQVFRVELLYSNGRKLCTMTVNDEEEDVLMDLFVPIQTLYLRALVETSNELTWTFTHLH